MPTTSFTWVDVGSDGSSGDARVFNASELKECIEDGSIGFPEPEPLPDDDKPMPYFIAADDAFALRTWLMKPYSKRQMSDTERIFNYRLSRAHRWRCLLTTLLQKPETVTSIVMACVCLHNLMRIRYPTLQNYEVDQEENNKPSPWILENRQSSGTSSSWWTKAECGCKTPTRISQRLLYVTSGLRAMANGHDLKCVKCFQFKIK